MGEKRVPDRWEVGEAYENYVGRWSRQVAPRFLDWLERPTGLRWLDVGCGTGALSEAVLSRCAPAAVAGVEPSEGFRKTARARLGERVRLYAGSADAIPLDSGTVDVVVSGLVLNFVPDARAALREMARVTRPGGMIAAYVWDYAEMMQPMRYFWDAAVELDPASAHLDESVRFPLCRPEALRELWQSTGLVGVETTAIDLPTVFASFEDYWQPFLGGQGSAPSYAVSLDPVQRGRLRDHLRQRLPVQPDGSITLTARAWAVRGELRGD